MIHISIIINYYYNYNISIGSKEPDMVSLRDTIMKVTFLKLTMV